MQYTVIMGTRSRLFFFFTKGRGGVGGEGELCDVLCSSLYEKAIPNIGLIYTERICSIGSKLFPLRADLIEKGCKL